MRTAQVATALLVAIITFCGLQAASGHGWHYRHSCSRHGYHGHTHGCRQDSAAQQRMQEDAARVR